MRLDGLFAVGVLLLITRVGQANEQSAPRIPRDLVRKAKAAPCALVAAALGARDGSKSRCEELREKNGDLLVRLVLNDGGRELDLVRRGQRCAGDYVGADLRPAKQNRLVSYLKIKFTFFEANHLVFDSWVDMYELLPSGEVAGTVGGCLQKVSGRVRWLDGQGWRPSGPRNDGCSE